MAQQLIRFDGGAAYGRGMGFWSQFAGAGSSSEWLEVPAHGAVMVGSARRRCSRGDANEQRGKRTDFAWTARLRMGRVSATVQPHRFLSPARC